MPQDLKTYMPQAKSLKPGPHTVNAPGFEKVDGETIPRRNVKAKDKLHSRPLEEIKTIPDILKYASTKYGNAKCVGTRKLIKLHNETKKVKKLVDGKQQEVDKKWTYFEMSGYKYQSFSEFEKQALQYGAGLRKLGLTAGDKVHLYAPTSAHWLSMAHGAMFQSMAIVTAYDTLGEEGLTHSIKQTQSKAMYLDSTLLVKLLNPLSAGENLKHLIYDDATEVKQDDISKLKEKYNDVEIISIADLQKLGEENPVEAVMPKPEDLACVMYTSGSTGTPKGVLLKHKNVVAALAGVNPVVGQYLGPGDSLLTYLPSAHIFEFVFENAVLFWGGTMGYGNGKTLSDTSMRNCKGDIREFKPTVLIGVPAVWETVKKGIMANVQKGGMLKSNMFWGAYAAKSFMLNNGIPGYGLLDSIVFSKVRQATGGRLRLCLNGGGPIAQDTQRFISIAITAMINGYGLTETSAMGALMDPQAWTDDALGELPTSIETKLVDFADAGYYSTNKPRPQGEIWIRGDSISSGYLDLDDETKESFTEDGWFKTGDIGEFDERGNLKIIDRKKNLVKTLNGEYIALEKLESIYRTHPAVLNICVYAHPEQSKPIAIVVPSEPVVQKTATENGIKGGDIEELIHNEKLKDILLKQFQEAGRKGRLAGFELIDGLVLADEEWTPQNGFTTAAQKIDRKKIFTKYQKDIDRAYSK
ncbi:acetyl-CoA synthetase-like protein [Pseudovirgaria hyperparasitica]|uniref:Acetyl-CoA synthetase-like protein n=1 Tax=Pseudovirgaria hyperparasitica TaxID=470096 RepID=A0A6A6WL74_9PEZI|nr:acetyl-CoA synthetase-like protein [Pseudovirgaria hyperparasitica]KAF2762931.1 acetyl-CoA synthetase-like protein [Pseudovirgaria hyperparasitica]